MDSAQVKAYLYGLVRDVYGNLTRLASGAQWQSLSPSLIGLQGTTGKLWEGVITRVPDAGGTATARGVEAGLQPDSVPVIIKVVSLLALRFVDQTGNSISSVSMTTDQTQIVRIQGRWSDNPSAWVDVSASLSISPDSLSAKPPVGQVSQWTFSPERPGQAVLRATVGSVFVNLTLTVTPAPPSRVEIALLDPYPVAGQPFKVVVRIFNTDGLVPGTWCDSLSIYQDVVMHAVGWQPQVATGEATAAVNLRPDSAGRVRECFFNGIDTVQLTLYHADAARPHNVFVLLHGTQVIQANTGPFLLSPGEVARVVIGDGACASLPDTTLQAPNDVLIAQLCGYDKYGNAVGPVPGSWTVASGGTLSPPSEGLNTVLSYPTDRVVAPQQGCIVATFNGVGAITDTICLTITPPVASFRATTRDTNGNGYLDRIEIYCFVVNSRTGDRVPVATNLPTGATIAYQDRAGVYEFDIASIQSLSGQPRDSVFVVVLKEPTSKNRSVDRPQTGWRPRVTFEGSSELTSTPITAEDGAGPVVWRAVRKITSFSDPRQDVISLTFSEPLATPLGAANSVELTLNAWIRGSGGLDPDNVVLKGITSFLTQQTRDASGAKFLMSNGQVLTGNHFLGFDVVTGLIIADTSGNRPHPQNEPAPVIIEGIPVQVIMAPVPFGPTMAHMEENRVMRVVDYATAAGWTRSQGGVMVVIDVTLTDKDMEIEGTLSVHDLAGNLVHSRGSGGKTILNESVTGGWQVGSVKRMAVYWNGVNDRGMPVEKGAYRAKVTLELKGGATSASTVPQTTVKIFSLGVK